MPEWRVVSDSYRYGVPKYKQRLSVSLPPDLVKWVRSIAKEYNTPISAVVAQAIANMKAQELSAEMVRGLLEDSFSNVENKKITVE